MENSRKQIVVNEIENLMLDDRGPFPHDDIRFVLEQAGSDYYMVGPDLNTFCMTVIGYCSSADRIEHWDPSRLTAARQNTIYSFFDEYPEYQRLQWVINERDTPSLSATLIRYERMRRLLRELLADASGDGT